MPFTSHILTPQEKGLWAIMALIHNIGTTPPHDRFIRDLGVAQSYNGQSSNTTVNALYIAQWPKFVVRVTNFLQTVAAPFATANAKYVVVGEPSHLRLVHQSTS